MWTWRAGLEKRHDKTEEGVEMRGWQVEVTVEERVKGQLRGLDWDVEIWILNS
jgi:hypothetical protein